MPPKRNTGRKKSAKKAHRQSLVRNQRNKSVKTNIRGLVKKVETAKGNDQAQKLLGEVFSAVDKAVKRNIIHTNQAGRIKSRLSLLVGKSAPAAKSA